MNELSNKELTTALRQLCSENDAARRLFKSFSERKNDARETSVERAAWLASSDYQTMLAIFKKLDTIGAGLFVVGRHSYPSRMQWKYSIRSIGEIGLGESNLPEDVAEDAVAEDVPELGGASDASIIRHEFQIRGGTKVKFELPADLTDKEAERLALFIRALPF